MDNDQEAMMNTVELTPRENQFVSAMIEEAGTLASQIKNELPGLAAAIEEAIDVLARGWQLNAPGTLRTARALRTVIVNYTDAEIMDL